jgi:hypothetical protein
MSATQVLILECVVAVIAALGMGLLVGGLLGGVPGVGAGLLVVAVFALLMLLAYERGVDAR